jgi:hypothetical protein
VKNRRKTISPEEKLDVISHPVQGEGIVDICHNVRLDHSSVRIIRDNADRIKEVLSQELKCLCTNSTTVLSEYNVTKTVDESLLHFVLH